MKAGPHEKKRASDDYLNETMAYRYDVRMPAANDPLQVLAAAVTPVVLVSATAILISGVNARYISIADKMRSLAQEFRSAAVHPARRAIIAKQINIFRSRIRLVAWAERVLYLAVACFILLAMIITVSNWRKPLGSTTIPLFGIGILLILTAILCQLRELHLSNRTITLEISDVNAD